MAEQSSSFRRSIAFCMAVAILAVLVSPFVDLYPTTIGNAGLVSLVPGVYRLPDPRAHAAATAEALVAKSVKPVVDVTCSRLC